MAGLQSSLWQRSPDELAEALFRESGDAIIVVDPASLTIVDVNPMVVKFTGMARDILVGSDVTELVQSEAHGAECFSNLKLTGTFHSRAGFRLRTHKPDHWIPVSVSISRLHFSDSPPLGLFMLHDMREINESKDKAERTSNELKRVLQSLNDCVWNAIVDIAGQRQYVYMSPVIERITGHHVSQFLEQPSNYLDIVHPDDQAAYAQFTKMLRGTQSDQLEYRVCRTDGTVCWVNEQVNCTHTANGDVTHLFGIVTDITERKQNEQALRTVVDALRKSEERLNLTLDATTDGVWDWNIATGEVVSNPQWFKSLGYESSEVQAHFSSFEKLVHPEDMPRFKEVLNEHLEGQTETFEFENRLRTKSGAWRWNMSRGKVVERDEDGRPLRMVGTDSDITDRKRTEQKLKRAKEELEERVQQRTESLARAVSDLQDEMARRRTSEDQAREHLQKLAHFGRIHALGEMASGLAHELNQPLAAISGQSEICMQFIRQGSESSSADILKSLEEITEQAQRAGAINHMLRNFARRREFQRSKIMINELIQQVATLMEFDARQHDVVLKLELGKHVPELLADRIQLEQVLVNLIRNATEAMRESSDRTLTIRSGVNAAGDVTIAVIDSGQGLPTERPARVFDSYYTTKPDGMGLGLAICRTLIEAHGGRIEATANSNHGATFSCTLPANRNESTHAA